jgi:hypothetical protein
VRAKRLSPQLFRFTFTFPEGGHIDNNLFLKLIRNNQLLSDAKFVFDAEQREIKEIFMDGANLSLDLIRPRIHICVGREDFRIFNYARLLQSVPSGRRVGREIRALVFDEGHGQPRLMGAIGLASSSYSIACRDSYLTWTSSKNKKKKDSGLRSTMDLSLCVSVPPYSYLFGGKLMALLSFSEPIVSEFNRKYKEPLLAIIASCATGIHCPIFNRIMIRPGGLFRRIGQTAGYSTLAYSSSTTAAARHLLTDLGKLDSSDRMLCSKSLRILKTALDFCDLPIDPFLRMGSQKGVYLAFLNQKDLICLRKGRRPQKRDLITYEEAINFWRTKLIPKLSDVSIDKMKSFRASTINLSKDIKKARTYGNSILGHF